MDANRLRTGELIAGVSAVALLVVMFLPWFGIDFGTGVAEDFAEDLGVETSANFNAWESFGFIDLVLLVTIVVAVGLAASKAMARNVSLPVAASAVTAGLGILSTVLVLYRLIDPVEDASREFGLFLGLIAAAGIAYGGWRSMQEEGTTFAGEADRIGDRDADTDRGPTTPPPAAERGTSDPPPPPPPPTTPPRP